MSQAGVNYDVNAWLRTKGSFDREVDRAVRSADKFGNAYSSMSRRLVTGGDAIRGSFGAIAASMAKGSMALGGGALAFGTAKAVGDGLNFLDTMESSKMTVATIYQMFGLSSNAQDVLNGKVSEFTKNLEQSEAVQQRIRTIAETAPGGFAEINQLYQYGAAGLMGATQNLERQMSMLQKMSVMAGVVDNDFRQLGADFGRMLSGQAGADIRTFQVLKGPIEEAMIAIMDLKKAPKDLAQSFNKLDAVKRLEILEKVLGTLPQEAIDSWSNTSEALKSAAESSVKDLKGTLAMPLRDSLKDALKIANSDTGILGGGTFKGLQEASLFAGGVISNVFERGWRGLEATAVTISNHWREIATMIRDAGFTAGLAIKSAIAIGVTRWIMGTALATAGKAMANGRVLLEAAKPVADWIGRQSKQTHMALGRGMKGGGTGMLGAMGRGMGRVAGKDDGFRMFRGLDKGLLKFAALTAVIGSLGTVTLMATAAIGAIGIVIAGAAAFFVSKWKQISGSIVQGLQDGSITLVPLIISLHTFWLRLEMVGQALFGGASAAGAVSSGLGLMTSAVDLASGTISWFIKGLSIMVGAWGTLKLGMLGVLVLIEKIVALGVKLRVVDQSVLDRGRSNIQKYQEGVQDTFTRADQLASAAERIGNAKLSPLDVAKAEEKAKALSAQLSDLLSGKDKEGKGRGTKSKVSIAKVEVKIDTRDPDPDRLFAAFVPKLERMADKRVQPYEALEGGT